jgi:predicted ATP-dependent protease
MNEARNDLDGSSSTRKQAQKVKTQAREIVELLEEASKLMAEDNVVQPAMKHLHTALNEAKSRATVLEDWYQRTYSPVVEGVHVAR